MKVSIVGATGYTGAELLRLLSYHDEAEVLYVTSESSTGKKINDLYPHLNSFYDSILVSMDDLDKIAEESDVVFVALPHGHAMDICPKILKMQAKVIDLGADYRFKDKNVYEKWYKVNHTDHNTKAVYGLSEFYRDEIKKASFVANPGCYVTASLFALMPLVKKQLIDTKGIVIDAKSGATGGGRTLSLGNHFSEMVDSFRPYSVTTHRHTAEIEEVLSSFAGHPLILNFTPHLLPIDRGILATCYADLEKNATKEKIAEAFKEMYGEEFFVRLLPEGVLPSVKTLRGSNFIDIAWIKDERTEKIVIMSALDNLVKGAAGQAIQNMNIMFDLPENMGLKNMPLYP